MLRSSHPAADLFLPLEEAMLFVIQRLITRHVDLLAAPEEADLSHAEPPLRATHRILDAVRELHDALSSYRDILSDMRAPRSGGLADPHP